MHLSLLYLDLLMLTVGLFLILAVNTVLPQPYGEALSTIALARNIIAIGVL